MATAKATINLTNPTQRAKLAARREPYWAKIQAGLYLGYRRSTDKDGGGYWIARRAGEDMRYEYLNIGSDQDSTEANGITHGEALAKVNEWTAERVRGIQDNGETVADICRLYVEDRREEKGEATAYDADKRFERLVYSAPIGKIPFKELQEATVKSWRRAQIDDYEDEEDKARKQDSANRNLKAFKAIPLHTSLQLNLAHVPDAGNEVHDSLHA